MDRVGQRAQGRCHEQRADRRDFGTRPHLSYIAAQICVGSRMPSTLLVSKRFICMVCASRGVLMVAKSVKWALASLVIFAAGRLRAGPGRHPSPVVAECAARCGNRARGRNARGTGESEGADRLARDLRALRPRLAGVPRQRHGPASRRADGRDHRACAPREPVTEPFLTLLVEVNSLAAARCASTRCCSIRRCSRRASSRTRRSPRLVTGAGTRGGDIARQPAPSGGAASHRESAQSAASGPLPSRRASSRRWRYAHRAAG